MFIVALKIVFSAFSTCKHFASWSKIHSYIVILNTMCRAASPCGRGLTRAVMAAVCAAAPLALANQLPLRRL